MIYFFTLQGYARSIRGSDVFLEKQDWKGVETTDKLAIVDNDASPIII